VIGVVDSTVLIALEKLGRFELLAALFDDVVLPIAVLMEVGGLDWLVASRILEFVPRVSMSAPLRPPPDVPTTLGSGERAVIALAQEHDAVAVLDDRAARAYARSLGLDVIGTCGLLVEAKRLGCVARVKPIIEALRDKGFRLSPKVVEAALSAAGELESDAE